MTEDNGECQFWEGFAGDDLLIPIQLIDENGLPEKIADSDGVTEIVAEFMNGNGIATQIKLTEDDVAVVDGTCGRAAISVSKTISATLKTSAVAKQTFTVYIIKNSLKRTWVFDKGLLLKPRPVPTS